MYVCINVYIIHVCAGNHTVTFPEQFESLPGANVGGFTVPLAERVGPEGEVHAFEPFRKAGVAWDLPSKTVSKHPEIYA